MTQERRIAWLLSSREDRHAPPRLGPNWFASVMGTGIVAVAAAGLPLVHRELHPLAVGAWLVAAALLVTLVAAVAVRWSRSPEELREHAADPTMAQFFGAPPMAFMTVGAGALVVGGAVVGHDAAVAIDWVLWSLGTAGGLATAIVLPFLLFTRYEVRHDAAFGGWLMPVVPPMVSAATGAMLVPHLAGVTERATLLYACWAMFGLSLVASLVIITLIWSRLAYHGSSGTVRVPTLWIVLGPLGQSITAAGLLAAASHGAVRREVADVMDGLALVFGVAVWGFAALWIALATALTVRTLRRGLPFALTWWSLTFPVGTFVTGTTQLASHTGLPALRWAAVAAFAGLLGAWITVASRTASSTLRGELLHPTTPPTAVGTKG